MGLVSIHAPWEGCDCRTLGTFQLRFGSFNSRTLGRVRQAWFKSHVEEVIVSIHAPWEGCDLIATTRASLGLPFQFTHPGKGATISVLSEILVDREFQFTHPGKGATFPSFPCWRIACVSIHAPWEGCDISLASSLIIVMYVSIHAPWEGCDAREDCL